MHTAPARLVPANGVWRALCALLLALGGWLGGGASRAAEAPYVAAAADLEFALTEIAQAFTRASGRQVKLSFGSSGNFARQIPQGAPFELFFSADEDYVLRLAESGYALDRGVLYAVGRIALFVPHGSAVKADVEFADVAAAANDGRIRRFAIANPEHAPYGRAAREALQHAGIWERLQGRLVLGENASQAAQFATSGSAQGGIIPLSLAMAPALASEGSYAVIPADWHKPLRQRMALLRGAGATARSFYEFVQQPQARAILDRYGFALPGDQVR